MLPHTSRLHGFPGARFLLAITILTGILFGLAPALRLSRLDINAPLKEGGQGSGMSSRRPVPLCRSGCQRNRSRVYPFGRRRPDDSQLPEHDPHTIGLNTKNILSMDIILRASKYSYSPIADIFPSTVEGAPPGSSRN